MDERILALRREMENEGMDAWLTPSADPHLSEYVAEHWKCRAWLSGFTGSAGTLVVTKTESLLWTDGRYFVQAERELAGTATKLMKIATPGFPTILEWLEQHLPEGGVLGLDATLFPASQLKEYGKKLGAKGITIAGEHDLPGRVWQDRPAVPATPVFVHELQYAGKTPAEKLAGIREAMMKKKADHLLLSALDGIAWLCNIRGGDVKNNPVTIAYARVGLTDVELFIDGAKLDDSVRRHLEDNGIQISGYDTVLDALRALPAGCRVAYDPKLTNAALVRAIPAGCAALEADDLVVKAKALKNEVEIRNLRQCHARDGAAMVRFLMWLESAMEASSNGGEPVTELDVMDCLRDLRAALPLNRGESFDTIAAYGANAAMMHYSATPQSHATLAPRGLLLVDCGGQYLDGTTDITRTVALGPLTEEERTACTLTLQSHIGLARAVFLDGSTGSNLDVLARLPMWRNGMDYKCGTGHGVGFFLSVHEGPQGFRQTHSPVKLEPGMIITNEPGVYRAGQYGVRTENTVLVVPAFETEDGTFHRLDTISCCPIDLETLDLARLTADEKEWLNAYHQFVYHRVTPFLDGSGEAWLRHATRPV
jgi:Xaa-Pro aminopeptidase